MKYADYVSLGRKLLRKVRCYQVQIAFYATKVCEIRHGGHSKGIYTLKRYSTDIGVPFKTLQTWVQVYRNVIQKLDLDIKNVSPEQWKVASRVNNHLKFEKTVGNSAAGTPGKKNGSNYKQKIGKDRLKKLFKDLSQGSCIQSDIYNWTDTIIFIKNRLATRDLSAASHASLVYLQDTLDKASQTITKHIAGE